MTFGKPILAAMAVSLALAFSISADAAQLKSRGGASTHSGAAKLTGNGKPVGDLYCKNNSRIHVPCDYVFENYCKLIGGTISGSQGWGGKTCYHPHEW